MNDAAAAIGEPTYVSLTTFRRNGIGVATPVWIAPDGEDLLVITDDNVGKTKRLAHTARVELRPCNVRGVVAPDAPTYAGRAHVERGTEAVSRVRTAMGRKLGWWYRALVVGERLAARVPFLPRRRPTAMIVITDVERISS